MNIIYGPGVITVFIDWIPTLHQMALLLTFSTFPLFSIVSVLNPRIIYL